MDISEFQADTAAWGATTFGPPNAGQVARRMNVEVAELLISLDVLADLPGRGIDREEATQHAGEECADVFIMLVQVAAALGVDLGKMAQAKMAVNRKRQWGRTPGGMVQHVDNPAEVLRGIAQGAADTTGLGVDHAAFDAAAEVLAAGCFKEEGSGLIMEPDKWYVLSDSGSAYTAEGFITAAHAMVWCRGLEGQAAGAANAEVPAYDRERHEWTGQDGVNIMLGGDLRDFWEHNPLEEPA